MSVRETSSPGAASAPGLRERKKRKTRQAIRREAFRLFAAQGYEATAVDQIAAAAEVSPSTFFRYFPTKEDVVLYHDDDPVLIEALTGRPADEPVMDAIRHSLADSLAQLLAADREELLFRARLTFSVPAIRARSMDEQLNNQAALAGLIAERAGLDVDDLGAKCAAATIVAVFTTVVWHWVDSGGVEDLTALHERHLGLLCHRLRF